MPAKFMVRVRELCRSPRLRGLLRWLEGGVVVASAALLLLALLILVVEVWPWHQSPPDSRRSAVNDTFRWERAIEDFKHAISARC